MITKNFTYIATNKADIKLFTSLLTKAVNSNYLKNELLDLKVITKNEQIIKIKTTDKLNKQWITVYKLLYVDYEEIQDYLFKLCNSLLEIVMAKLPKLKTSKGYELNVDAIPSGSQISCLNSFIYYGWHDAPEHNWISKATDLLIRFCQGHFIFNGNKRSAVLMMTAFLYENRIYLQKSYNNDEYIERWEKIVCEIVDSCEYKKVRKNGKIVLEKINSKIFSSEELFQYVYNHLYKEAYLSLF
ncbi:hypothetical protein SCLARK_001220 [Spiroplasma clarkii]|uniref:Fido domain-containing protein n=1 Tax=Spiroplasma clarkii TaxID=2139 RepID=A0A1Y0L187_9MOLU|nr:hypothetical protein [Spiroplasma clarkii]ARU91772.1 hypothetical protein SCLARK_001220 [Spiroplasma clarkii]ATX71145.1 hypothetical protein SCLAR_v1c08370 [Spiroplasma clarkii]